MEWWPSIKAQRKTLMLSSFAFGRVHRSLIDTCLPCTASIRREWFFLSRPRQIRVLVRKISVHPTAGEPSITVLPSGRMAASSEALLQP